MGWTEKGKATPFDNVDIEKVPGIFFLDGDALATFMKQKWTVNQKYPMLRFPSGEEFAIWESGDPDNAGVVHVFGEIDLRYNDERDKAYEHATYVAEQCGYAVDKVGEEQLKVRGQTSDEHYLLTYKDGAIADIKQIKGEWEQPVHPGHILMNDEIKEQLPELYSNEEIGLEAIAPVKYFTPDSSWTWYPSEYDPEHKIFYGLVIGFEIEFGMFSLEELQELRGPMGLQIERDLHYQQKTLRELKEMHESERSADRGEDINDIPF
jgi:hypothetical protein